MFAVADPPELLVPVVLGPDVPSPMHLQFANLQKKTAGWVRVSSLLGDFALLPLQAASKYNSQYHKLFKDIPTEESVLKGGQRGEGRVARG